MSPPGPAGTLGDNPGLHTPLQVAAGKPRPPTRCVLCLVILSSSGFVPIFAVPGTILCLAQSPQALPAARKGIFHPNFAQFGCTHPRVSPAHPRWGWGRADTPQAAVWGPHVLRTCPGDTPHPGGAGQRCSGQQGWMNPSGPALGGLVWEWAARRGFAPRSLLHPPALEHRDEPKPGLARVAGAALPLRGPSARTCQVALGLLGDGLGD